MLWTNARTDSSKNAPSPVRTFLVFSVVVVSMACLPYMLVRNRLADTQKQLASLRHMNIRLRREQRQLQSTLQGGLRHARRHTTTVLSREGKKTGALLKAVAKSAEERDERRNAWENEMKNNMDVLLNQNLAQRARLAAELKELGQSLADTAAFIEEVEVRQGWTPRPGDGRGIERTRRLAKRLQQYPGSMEEETKPPPEQTKAAEPDAEAQSQR
ncbi:hypothetical protein BV20DRAFT_959668 [Pilatotrama ljubarskyi]|nr:hypothetical protein BV20DRAFT_959668 [Pilatotrama ljubarskyi]